MKKNNVANKYIEFSQMAFEMMTIIAAFAYLGNFLEDKYPHTAPYAIASLSLLGVCIAIWLVIKKVTKISQQDDKIKDK